MNDTHQRCKAWPCTISCSHLNSCTYSCRVITPLFQLMSEKEEVLITGGEEETSLEELNKLTNPVWDPVTPSSSALNLDHSTTITHPSHGRESTWPWIIPVGRCKHWGPKLVCHHCLYCPLVGWCAGCMRGQRLLILTYDSAHFKWINADTLLATIQKLYAPVWKAYIVQRQYCWRIYSMTGYMYVCVTSLKRLSHKVY